MGETQGVYPQIAQIDTDFFGKDKSEEYPRRDAKAQRNESRMREKKLIHQWPRIATNGTPNGAVEAAIFSKNAGAFSRC
jgi:hypothetical protein